MQFIHLDIEVPVELVAFIVYNILVNDKCNLSKKGERE